MSVNLHLAQGRWLIPFLIAALLSSLALTPLYAQSEPQSDSAPTISDAELIREINAYVGQQFAEGKFSGTVLIAKEGEPIYQQAFGLASIAYEVPNRIDTKFNLGSMNKMFTAVAIAQLAEQGKLGFDDPISTHLPDYPNAEVAENVTIHHLLTHTSGLAEALVCSSAPCCACSALSICNGSPSMSAGNCGAWRGWMGATKDVCLDSGIGAPYSCTLRLIAHNVPL